MSELHRELPGNRSLMAILPVDTKFRCIKCLNSMLHWKYHDMYVHAESVLFVSDVCQAVTRIYQLAHAVSCLRTFGQQIAVPGQGRVWIPPCGKESPSFSLDYEIIPTISSNQTAVSGYYHGKARLFVAASRKRGSEHSADYTDVITSRQN